MTPRELAEKIVEIFYEHHGPSTPDFSESEVKTAIEFLLSSVLEETKLETWHQASLKTKVLFDEFSQDLKEAKAAAYEECAQMFEGAGDTLFTANQIVDLIRCHFKNSNS